MDQRAEREFREYVQTRHAALFRVAMLLAGRREDAEDLLQSALTKLALHWTRVASSGSVDAYMRKILYHQQVSWWRRRRGRQELITDHPPERGTVGDLAGEITLRITLAGVLSQLTKRQRAVIVLRSTRICRRARWPRSSVAAWARFKNTLEGRANRSHWAAKVRSKLD